MRGVLGGMILKGIFWPIRESVIVSEKDRGCPPLRDAETNFEY
jgi:dTDP-4-dehydrorhamnose 3,5-epimerase